MKSLLPLLAAASLLGGCTTITNLTPAMQPRNSTGLYSIEVQWDTREQAIRPETLKPSVLVGLDLYAMKPTPLVQNRWETLVPIAPDKDSIRYRFKFDYDVAEIPARHKGSKLSPEFKLQIGVPGGARKPIPAGSKADQEKAEEAIRNLK
jgi:uncharacterized protein YceK